MQLTKTDFIQYLDCPKSLWLKKHDPENYPAGEFSAFLQKLIREGYEVERYAQKLFDPGKTDRVVEFQKTFQTASGLYAQADIVVTDADGRIAIYEVKSSTKIKNERGQNHIKDACFQMICAEEAGYSVSSLSIIHVNKDYIRQGEINPEAFLTYVDVTYQAKTIATETRVEIDAALNLLQQDQIDRNTCSCRYKSGANHCDSFDYFNPHVPEYSIYCLPRLNYNKQRDLLDAGYIALEDVPDDFKLSPQQTLVVKSAKAKTAQINENNIISFFNKLIYPIYFFDYETFCSAVPFTDGVKPHQHIPVQYSLHRLSHDGSVAHFEYLAMEKGLPHNLILSMKSHIGPVGSILSWYDTFERTRNKEMALIYPEHAEFLTDINNRMIDLMDVFVTDYVDMRFKGSTSIKKVLPVVCPHLSYKDLNVQDGTGAMEAWDTMTTPSCDNTKKEQLRTQLLDYCKLDTWAMVELYNCLKNMV